MYASFAALVRRFSLCSLLALSLFVPHHGLSPEPLFAQDAPQEVRPSQAQQEHQQLFGSDSGVILLDPDAYLGASGFDCARAGTDVECALKKCHAPLDEQQRAHLGDALEICRATTELLGPASIHVEGLRTLAGTPVVLIVSHDAARPLQVAIHDLAGIDDPTVILLPELSFEELRSFTQFHESAHAFQHLLGTHHKEANDDAYLHAHEEAEADAFAVLCWYKFRREPERVCRIWHALRLSRTIEVLRSGHMTAATEYFTHTSVAAAISRAETLHREGRLASMSGEQLYREARDIVAKTLPAREMLAKEVAELRKVLEMLKRYPLRERLAAMAKASTPCDEETKQTLQCYRESLTALLFEGTAETSELSPRAQALALWRTRLEQDLQRTPHHQLVIERMTVHLAGETLDLAFSNLDTEQKRCIQHEGHAQKCFVPIEQKRAVLKELASFRR